MQWTTNLEAIPDLSGRIKLPSSRPIFNGNYSSVYRGELENEIVAVKVLKEIYGANSHTMERKLQRERTVWARLRHPNVLPLYGFANDNDLFLPFGAFISPWRSKGNASEYLNKYGKDISINDRVKMWKGVIVGVAYLHSLDPVLVHGDLKPTNVLMDNDGNPQICDFGLVSIYLEEGNSGMMTTSPYTGTDRYMAYELLHDQEVIAPTTRSDIFALGCIGLEFCFLRLPYAHRKHNIQGHIFIDIRAGKPPAEEPPNLAPPDNAIWRTLAGCWSHDPDQRPSVMVLLASLETLLHDESTAISEYDSHVIKNTPLDLSYKYQPNANDFAVEVVRATRNEFPNIIAGRGCVAMVRIHRGDLILQEAPWFRQSANQSHVLPQYTQTQEWLGLQPTPANGFSFGRGPDYDRFRINAMRCGLLMTPGAFHTEQALGIFLLATTFNSSCVPNIHAHWNKIMQRMEFRAVRDIQPREELCICYTVNTMLYPTNNRISMLSERHRFTCACSVCNQGVVTRQISDARRQGLRDIVEKGRGSIPEILQALNDLRTEGIHHFIDSLYYDAYLALFTTDHDHAMLYLQRARESAETMVGAEDDRVVDMTGRLPPHLR